MTQPEALRLADALETFHNPHDKHAAAELRRLHEKCEALTADVIQEMRRINEIHALTAQRDALLEALKLIVEFVDAPTEGKRPDVFVMRISKARAAIALAEGLVAKAEENT